ncbi:hypothetical protein PVAP13_5NG439020 [Panicum virgatum]|uniref:Uncharacterized protein n=1 Tax=Panicum virgatum TaxID=38727 RepID=A0A8T0S341_PANVG|nr:hypothetical protein PVAP13_5NG439020 [Panicum virgatum]
MGYKVFLTTGFFCQAMSVQSIYMDDKVTETDDFKTLWQCLESEIEHYEDILKRKLVFMPACSGKYYFVYCINLIHNCINILDSIDYIWGNTSLETRHRPVYNKIPIISAAF